MTAGAARVFTGHYDQLVEKGSRKRLVLWIAVDGDDRDALEAALGADRHHTRNIPIAFAIGRAAEALADTLGPSVPSTIAPPAAAPTPIGEQVSRIAALQVRMALYADAAASTSDLEHRSIGLGARDKAARELAQAVDTLNETFRALAPGGGW